MWKLWTIALLSFYYQILVCGQILNGNQRADFLLPREANLQCNTATKLKRITLKNPNTINKDTCSYTIRPYSSQVCQLLIEFQQFELQKPTLNPSTHTLVCGDHLAVGDFTLCGDNTGQHLYLPFDVANGNKEIVLTFNLPHRWSQSRWNLIVAQLECPQLRQRSPPQLPLVNPLNMFDLRTIFAQPLKTLDVLAPSGCNQYFTQTSGHIKSFNYKEDGSSYYLPNMNYVICIKAKLGSSMIEYQAQKFSMSVEQPSAMGYDNDCHSTVQTEGRREDYLMIPQSFVANSLNILPTYYCGTSLQTRPNIIASAPFMIYFSSDGFTDETETGFYINYHTRELF